MHKKYTRRYHTISAELLGQFKNYDKNNFWEVYFINRYLILNEKQFESICIISYNFIYLYYIIECN